MDITETIYAKDRQAWRRWLRANSRTKKEIWLVCYKKHCHKPGILYEEAVEEALCYGWIDSIIKRIDDKKYARKFTPRKPGSVWSQINIRRARKMIAGNKMTGTGMALFDEIRNKPTRNRQTEVAKEKPSMPKDLRSALAKNRKSLRNFRGFAPGYQRMYIRYILSAKQPETRKRRILKVVELAAQNVKSAML